MCGAGAAGILPVVIAALLSKKARKWAVMTVAVPVGRWALDQAATEVEKRRGETDKAARTLRQASGVLDRVSRRGRPQRTSPRR